MKENDNINQRSPQQQVTQLSFAQSTNPSYQIQHQSSLVNPKQSQHGYGLIVCFIILGFYFMVFAILELSSNYNALQYYFNLNKYGNIYKSDTQFVSYSQNNTISVYLLVNTLTQFDIGFNNPQDAQMNINICSSTNQQLNKTISVTNVTLVGNKKSIPCGKYLQFYPQGAFQIVRSSSNVSIPISTLDIITQVDYPYPLNIDLTSQWIDLQSPRLKNWLSMDSQLLIYKLWGKIDNFQSGDYFIQIKLINQNKIARFQVIMDNNAALGGYNTPLCYVNFLYAALVFVGALAAFLVQKKMGHKKILKRKNQVTGPNNDIKFFVNSAASTPATHFQ